MAPAARAPHQVALGGQTVIDNEVDEQSESDLLRAEVIIAPISLLILLLVFGSLVAASLPLTIAGVSVVGTLLVLNVLTGITDVSTFALNLTTGLGLGLAIDYSLLMVSRFRDALADTGDTERALQITLMTAGKTVIYSAVTVASSLAGLMVFNTFFLKSFGYAGVAVTALAGAAALVTLPAVLAILGPKVNALEVPFLRRRRQERDAAGHASPGWTRWANMMMRRPWLFAGAALAVLLVLAAPVRDIQFSLADDRALPADSPSSQVHQALRDNFPDSAQDDLYVLADGAAGSDSDLVDDYASSLSALEGIDRVDALSGTYVNGELAAPPSELSGRFAAHTGEGSYLAAHTELDPLSVEARQLVESVRALPAEFDLQVTGQAATLADTLAGQAEGLPWALGIMALATFILLTLMTGSVVVPIKAIVMNILTLAATFGIMVWVFQEGNLKWLIGDFQETGYIVSNMPLLLLCIAFGLSMDYEMFLLSRIKEEYDKTGDNRRAVATGIAQTSRIITAAALILAVVFLSFVTSGIMYLKLIGLGTGLAILIDATLIRAVLLPSVMALMGDANWWGPRFVKKWSASFSHGDVPVEEPTPTRSGDPVEPEALTPAAGRV